MLALDCCVRWWVVFWDLYMARTGMDSGGSSDAFLYHQAMQKHHTHGSVTFNNASTSSNSGVTATSLVPAGSGARPQTAPFHFPPGAPSMNPQGASLAPGVPGSQTMYPSLQNHSIMGQDPTSQQQSQQQPQVSIPAGQQINFLRRGPLSGAQMLSGATLQQPQAPGASLMNAAQAQMQAQGQTPWQLAQQQQQQHQPHQQQQQQQQRPQQPGSQLTASHPQQLAQSQATSGGVATPGPSYPAGAQPVAGPAPGPNGLNPQHMAIMRAAAQGPGQPQAGGHPTLMHQQPGASTGAMMGRPEFNGGQESGGPGGNSHFPQGTPVQPPPPYPQTTTPLYQQMQQQLQQGGGVNAPYPGALPTSMMPPPSGLPQGGPQQQQANGMNSQQQQQPGLQRTPQMHHSLPSTPAPIAQQLTGGGGAQQQPQVAGTPRMQSQQPNGQPALSSPFSFQHPHPSMPGGQPQQPGQPPQPNQQRPPGQPENGAVNAGVPNGIPGAPNTAMMMRPGPNGVNIPTMMSLHHPHPQPPYPSGVPAGMQPPSQHIPMRGNVPAPVGMMGPKTTMPAQPQPPSQSAPTPGPMSTGGIVPGVAHSAGFGTPQAQQQSQTAPTPNSNPNMPQPYPPAPYQTPAPMMGSRAATPAQPGNVSGATRSQTSTPAPGAAGASVVKAVTTSPAAPHPSTMQTPNGPPPPPSTGLPNSNIPRAAGGIPITEGARNDALQSLLPPAGAGIITPRIAGPTPSRVGMHTGMSAMSVQQQAMQLQHAQAAATAANGAGGGRPPTFGVNGLIAPNMGSGMMQLHHPPPPQLQQQPHASGGGVPGITTTGAGPNETDASHVGMKRPGSPVAEHGDRTNGSPPDPKRARRNSIGTESSAPPPHPNGAIPQASANANSQMMQLQQSTRRPPFNIANGVPPPPNALSEHAPAQMAAASAAAKSGVQSRPSPAATAANNPILARMQQGPVGRATPASPPGQKGSMPPPQTLAPSPLNKDYGKDSLMNRGPSLTPKPAEQKPPAPITGLSTFLQPTAVGDAVDDSSPSLSRPSPSGPITASNAAAPPAPFDLFGMDLDQSFDTTSFLNSFPDYTNPASMFGNTADFGFTFDENKAFDSSSVSDGFGGFP
ncbi:hypothetical protein DL93DRAFT_870113 [Clavulina sp. PMI_390]|nr:hypothetical protein DL93DRAFT_870113 [Clavulina sp. PMI_390]